MIRIISGIYFLLNHGLLLLQKRLGGIEVSYPRKNNPDHTSIPFYVISILLMAYNEPFKEIDLKCLVNVLTAHNFLNFFNTIFKKSLFVSKLIYSVFSCWVRREFLKV